jgi:hypothetical protein
MAATHPQYGQRRPRGYGPDNRPESAAGPLAGLSAQLPAECPRKTNKTVISNDRLLRPSGPRRARQRPRKPGGLAPQPIIWPAGETIVSKRPAGPGTGAGWPPDFGGRASAGAVGGGGVGVERVDRGRRDRAGRHVRADDLELGQQRAQGELG